MLSKKVQHYMKMFQNITQQCIPTITTKQALLKKQHQTNNQFKTNRQHLVTTKKQPESHHETGSRHDYPIDLVVKTTKKGELEKQHARDKFAPIQITEDL